MTFWFLFNIVVWHILRFQEKKQDTSKASDGDVEVNYVSERSSAYFANLYKERDLPGGHGTYSF